MWQEHPVLQQDLDRISSTASVPWDALHGRSVLVTGATGLIGSTLVKALLWHGLRHDAGIRVHALVRDVDRARARFADALAAGAPLSLLEGDVRALPPVDDDLDLVVHGASTTASRDFVTRPVDTIATTLAGTTQVLELARTHDVDSLVYLSSMEVYGAPDGGRTTESDFTGFDPVLPRSSYPESKRMAEALCAAYAAQHGVPAKVVRLTQTFGPGVHRDDRRVFADFARRATAGEDIVLHTAGDTERSYLYTADAVTAVLTVLLRGEDGQAYNAANERTSCSIRDMAELVARTCGRPSPVQVRVELEDQAVTGYAPTLKMDLDTSRLQELGWRPTVDLPEMYERMVAASSTSARAVSAPRSTSPRGGAR